MASCAVRGTAQWQGGCGWRDTLALLRMASESGASGYPRSDRSSHERLATARWVDMKEMAAEAVAAAKDKRLTIIPSEFEATWFRQAILHKQSLLCS